MHSSNALPPARPHQAITLHDIPADIWPIIVKHISLREGRSIGSLAGASKLLAQWIAPHQEPARLYRNLASASGQPPPKPLHGCMDALLELPYVDPAHRLELLPGVGAIRRRRTTWRPACCG